MVAGWRFGGALLLATSLACGRTALSDNTLVTVPGDDDQVIPEVVEPRICGTPRSSLAWSTPVQLSDVDALFAPLATNPTYSYYDPTLRDDGLTLYLYSDAMGAWRTYELTRASLTSPFTTIQVVPEDVAPTTISALGYQRVDAVNLAINGGGFHVAGNPTGAMVYVLSDPRDTPAQWALPANEDVASNPVDARLTATGRTIIFAAGGTNGNRALYTQTRSSLTEPFAPPVLVEGLPDVDVSAPWLSADERFLLFVRDDDHTPDANKIWMADRQAPAQAFGNVAATSVNGDHFDGEPYLLATGTTCELYIISVRDDGYPRLFRSILN